MHSSATNRAAETASTTTPKSVISLVANRLASASLSGAILHTAPERSGLFRSRSDCSWSDWGLAGGEGHVDERRNSMLARVRNAARSLGLSAADKRAAETVLGHR